MIVGPAIGAGGDDTLVFEVIKAFTERSGIKACDRFFELPKAFGPIGQLANDKRCPFSAEYGHGTFDVTRGGIVNIHIVTLLCIVDRLYFYYIKYSKEREKMKLGIIIGSTRQNRSSARLATWIHHVAQEAAADDEWQLIDLKDYDLPQFDEPLPPMAGQRPTLSEGTVRYLEAMTACDGFLIVTPEYNHGMPSALKNAIGLLDYQLMKKPVAIASHGVVGGSRANEQVRLVINSNLGGVPVPTGLTFYGKVNDMISEAGELSTDADPANTASAKKMIESLVWYADALRAAREK